MRGWPQALRFPVPPGPRLPRWMQTAGFLFFPATWIDSCRRRYGDVVTFRSLFEPEFVMVFDADLVKQVFRGSPDRLHAGEANALLGPVVGEWSVQLLDGAEHLCQRRLLLPPFHGERMRAYEQVMVEAADRAVDSWQREGDFTLLGLMQALTLDVIVRAVFGVTDPARSAELKRRLRETADRREAADLADRQDVLSMLGTARACSWITDRCPPSWCSGSCWPRSWWPPPGAAVMPRP